MSYIYHETSNVPIKTWTEGVPVEETALQQMRNVASLPFVYKHVAAMPDMHWGKGATVGSVIATQGAIVPAAVGVDIGCGMCAAKTSLMASDLPDNLHAIRSAIEKAVPHGRTDNGGKNDRGAWSDVPKAAEQALKPLMPRLMELKDRHKRFEGPSSRVARHVGTLGTGNHFIEVCLDEDDHVWVMLHSGSRGIGNAIGQYFIQLAKKDMERWFIQLPDEDLAYIVEGSEHWKDYTLALQWAQDYARINREVMLDATLEAIKKALKRDFATKVEAVNCHHNYVSRENHFGSKVWVTRKGAVRARRGDLGIIPGSMGTGSFIVRGLGNEQSFHSCSHGAGRAMSRNQAKKTISLDDHVKAMTGIEARLDEGVLDESPAAYKDISAVIAAQEDLIEVVHRLRQIVNVKG